MNQPKSYERQPGESARHFAWFYEFLMMGSTRTLLGAYRLVREKAGKSMEKQVQLPGAWAEAAIKWDWPGRAGEWDEEQRAEAQRVEQEKRVAQQAADMARWNARADQVRDKFFDEAMAQLLTASRARQRADQVLQFPISEKWTSPDGSITVEPLKGVTLGDAPRLLGTASQAAKNANDMARLACDLHLSKIALEIGNLDPDEVIAQSIATLESIGFKVIAPGEGDAI